MFFRALSSFVAASLVLRAHAQIAGQTVEFQSIIAAPPGSCLTATSNADGASVVMHTCNGTDTQSWLAPKGSGVAGPLIVFGNKCLDVKDGVNADGTKLQIWTCATGNTNQMWVPSNRAVTWSGKGKCLDVTDGSTAEGNPVQIWDCDSTNSNQLWNTPALTHPKSFTFSPKAKTSMCVSASANAANASVVIEPCSAGAASQTWSDPNVTGQVMIYDNLCMQPMGTGIGSGPIVLQPCDPNVASQRWSHETGTFNSGAFAKNCLDLTDGITTAGNQLQIFGCSNTAGLGDNINQDWVVTDKF